jgi:hypothetical protein
VSGAVYGLADPQRPGWIEIRGRQPEVSEPKKNWDASPEVAEDEEVDWEDQ